MIIERFEQQVKKHPDKLAVKTEKGSLTYNELDKFSNRIANKIKTISHSESIERGNIGVLLEDPSDMLAAVLGIMKSGNVYVPLVNDFPARRIGFIIDHAEINIFITDKINNELALAALDSDKNRETRLMVIEEIGGVGDRLEFPREVRDDVGASLLYTSGSTGVPKGVLQYHENILYYIRQYTENLGLTSADNLTLLASFSHDVTLLDMYAGLLNGAALFPLDLKKDGAFTKLSQWLKKEKITVWHSVPTIFRYFTAGLENKPKPQLPFLRSIVLGGESVLRTDIEKFNSFFSNCPNCQLYILYGQTESSYNSGTFFPLGKPVTGITLGEVNKGIDLLIVDDQGNEVDPLEVGEIIVVGRHMSPGYWQDEEKTREKFIDDPYGEEKNTRVYFTGDLGHRLMNGEIEFIGRKDSQIKLRGFRIELEEIEKVVVQYRGISEVAVIPVETSPQEKFIACYFAAGGDIELKSLQAFLGERLANYMVPAYFKQLRQLPALVSGKINKKALPPPEVSPEHEYVPPGTKLEKQLVEIWSEVLDLGKEVIGINSNFFQLGGHSLRAASLTAKIHAGLKVKVPLAEVFERQTVKELAEYIQGAEENRYAGILPVEKKDYYPLSSAQKRLYFIQQLDVQSTTYNMPYLFIMGAAANRQEFEYLFKQLMQRYEIFRTSFEMVNQEPVQRVYDYDTIDFTVDYFEAAPEEARDKFKDFITPFDLSRAPLFRVGLLRVGNDTIVLFDFHHIIADYRSLILLEKDCQALAEGKQLAGLALHYKDYCQWQNSRQEKKTVEKQGEYWLKMLDGELPVLELPYDYPRPAIQSFAGARYNVLLGQKETIKVKEFAKETDTTLFMVLIAAFNLVLSRLGSRQDIVLGIPVTVREHPDLQSMIGMLVNTLILRNYPAGEKKVIDFLQEVKQHTLDAFENQEYPFEDLVNQLTFQRIAGRNPIFDVMFNLEDERLYQGDTAELGEQDKFLTVRDTSRFDLTLTAVDRGDNVFFRVEYSTRLFKPDTMERIMEYFKRVVVSLAENLDEKVKDMDILSEGEKAEILAMALVPGAVYERDKTLHRLFAEQVEKSADSTAVVGSGEGVGKQNRHLTYDELNNKSNQLAYLLKEKGVQPGTIVGIMVKRSVEMIVGILAILKASGAYLPLNPLFPRERIRYMLADCDARILVSGLSGLNGEVEVIDLCRGEPLCSPKISLHHSSFINHHSGNLAYIIYTSGSTGKPKGVPITHANLSPLLHWGYKHLGLDAADRVIQNLSYYFDWSVWEIFISLTTGARLYMVPTAVLLDPGTCIDFIAKNGITVLHVTPTQYRYIVNVGQRLATLKYLFIGAEKLTHDLLRRSLASVNENCRVYNMYGPTEATVISAVLTIDRPADPGSKYKELSGIPIGKPIANTELLILNKHLKLCPVNTGGELYIAGDGTARGYLNNPELTAEKFCLSPFTFHLPPVYKTGDLCRWLPDGTIEFLGRIDHQVKIRGFRIELGEIESRLSNHEEVKEAVVLARGEGDRYLCAYIVVSKRGETSVDQTPSMAKKLREYLSHSLPDYMIPAYFTVIEKIPLTANGKIDIKALPETVFQEDESGTGYAPRNPIEEKLAEIWAEVLEREVPAGIGIDDNFFELGGHSLKATALAGKIHKELNVKISLAEIFITPTIRGLAEYIKSAARDKYAFIGPAEQKEYYALSSAQKRLYILQQMELASTAYNIPEFIPLTMVKETWLEKLEKTFIKLIERHESLRTSFQMVDEQPVQKVHDSVGSRGEPLCSPLEVEGFMHKFVRPFDLAKAPLLRAALVRTGEDECLLLVDMHHIISDGVSHEVLKKDFIALYEGEELPLLRIQYKDFSQWQNNAGEMENIKQQGAYWLKQFEGEIPVLHLPTDYPRPAVQSFEGNALNFDIPGHHVNGLKAIALQEKSTLYMVLLAVYNVLLAKLSSQEDIVVGTPIAGRKHADLQYIIGMFVNTLALRNYPLGEKTFTGLLQNVRARTLAAFENQDYQFENVVEEAAVNRDASRNPLFDVMFTLDNLDTGRLPGKPTAQSTETAAQEKGTAKFDLTLRGLEAGSGENMFFSFQYSTRLFKKETLERFIKYFKQIVSVVAGESAGKISEIEILSIEEKERLLFDFNRREADYPGDKTIRQLFEEQVEKTPDSTAVVSIETGGGPKSRVIVFASVSLTYKELHEESNQVAHYLCSQGVRQNDLVGITVERSIEMIVGILGVFKAGCAYVPMDPKAPAARKNYIVDECNIEILLTTQTLFEGVRKIFPEDFSDSSGAAPSKEEGIHHSSSIAHHPGDLAYVIFTSGSTGKPKGVSISHANLCPLLHWGYKHLAISPGDRTLQNLSYHFDWSVWEIFITLTSGASLHMVLDEILLNPGTCISFIIDNKITILHATPTQYSYLVDLGSKPLSLRYLFIGAEKLTADLVRRSFESVSDDCRVFNMYGPTEATIISSVLEINRGDVEGFEELSSIPIGKPVGNTELLILDKYLKLCPVKTAGELYIAGDGVGQGYLNSPELTAERFCLRRPGGRFLKKLPPWTPRKNFLLKGTGKFLSLYRTGDLCRWLPDGTIEFLGRIDHQVKIRGFRIELGEIENQLLTHGQIKEAVVLAGGEKNERGKGEGYLCAYIVSERELPVLEIREYLAADLPDYMIPSYFVRLENIPLTANGKVDGRALSKFQISNLKSQYEHTAPRNSIEKTLAEIWSEVLENVSIGIDDDFFELGGHSLKATVLLAKIHKTLEVKLPLVEIFKTPTIRELAQSISGAGKNRHFSIEPVEKKEYYVLSSTQKRLYILQQIDRDSTAYNMPEVVPLQEEPGIKELEKVFLQLIERHETLRTSFELVAGQAVQRIYDNVGFEIEYFNPVDSGQWAVDSRGFVRPFDLSQGPLLRVGLSASRGNNILLVDMHHIISDGVSHEVLVKDFFALFLDQEFPVLRLQYKDFSEWQTSETEKENIKRQGAYWLKAFEGEIPLLDMPTDYERPAIQHFGGSSLGFSLDKEPAAALKKLAAKEGVTMYMVFLALYNVLLAKMCSQEDIVIGTPVAGRRHADLEKIIGMFVNTLALRNYPGKGKSFKDFLNDVKERTLDAFENQDYPFEDLVDKVEANRDMSRNPLFDIMFSFREINEISEDLMGTTSDDENIFNTSKFDMTLTVYKIGEEDFYFDVKYSTLLFKEKTIEKFIESFKGLVSSVVEDTDKKISQIKLAKESEREEIMAELLVDLEEE